MKNNFQIDLSVIDLTPEQIISIDSAIQKAVSSELAKLQTREKIILVPIDNEKGGGFNHDYIMGYRGRF